MKARIVDYRPTRGSHGLLILDLEEDFRSQHDELHDSDIDVTVKKWFPARSKDANAYAWVLINKIASKMNRPKVEVYREFVRNYGKTTQVCVQIKDIETEVAAFCEGHLGRMVDIEDSKLDGCVVLHKRYGSSSFDSQEMGKFIDAIIDECRELHIDTKSKEEIDSLLKEWK